MKRIAFYILLLFAPAFMLPANGQSGHIKSETEYFTHYKLKDSGSVFLFTRNSFDSIPKAGNQISIQQPHELGLEIQRFLKAQFTDLTDEEKSFFDNTWWVIKITADKRCHSSHFIVDSAQVRYIPQWEERLYRMTEAFKEIDFSPYGLDLSKPDDPESNWVDLTVPLRWIWKDLSPSRNH